MKFVSAGAAGHFSDRLVFVVADASRIRWTRRDVAGAFSLLMTSRARGFRHPVNGADAA